MSKFFILTGGIASGKSFVLKEFEKHGFKIIDSDAIVSSLYRNKFVKSKILKEFGTVNKSEIGEIIFSSLKKRKKLESILHPFVFKEIKLNLLKFKKSQIPIIVDIPLFFELKSKYFLKHSGVIVIKCFKKNQIQRLLKKGFSKKQAFLRINSQMPLNKKLNKADYIINNSKDKKFALFEVRKLVKVLLYE